MAGSFLRTCSVAATVLVVSAFPYACTGGRETVPPSSPHPPVAVDFVPLWPEHTPAELSAAQTSATAGDAAYEWRTDPEVVATRFATQVLRWDGVKISEPTETWSPDGGRRQFSRVYLCMEAGCPRDSPFPFQEEVVLQGLAGPSGEMWTVKNVNSSDLSLGGWLGLNPVPTPTLEAGSTKSAYGGYKDGFPPGSKAEVGSLAWGCSPSAQASRRPLWFDTTKFQVLAGSDATCASSPGLVYALRSDSAQPLGPLIFDASADLPQISSFAATPVRIERKPGPLPPPPPPWIDRNPLSLRDCRASELTLERPELGENDIPPRPYGRGIYVRVRRSAVCRAHFAITLTIEDQYGNPLPISGNPATLRNDLSPLGYPGILGTHPGGAWDLRGWCGRDPAILKVAAFGQVRQTAVDDVYACGDYAAFDIPKAGSQAFIGQHPGRTFRDAGNI